MQRETLTETLAGALKVFGALFDAFESSGFQLYAVGGCVRDWCLGRTPKDVDFTTDATPQQTSEVLSAHGMKVIPVGEAFGTIATLIGKQSYEITSFRVKESYTKGSRHPVVRYGKSLAQDLERRDLTINAMAVDRHGQLMDPFDGLGDLERGELRVPRSTYERSIEIFSDDPLRILRLARFLARLNFSVANEATRAAQFSAGTVLDVSHERWFAELDGLLRASYVSAGLKWLVETGVLGLLLPEIAVMLGSARTITSLSGDMGASSGASANLLDQTAELVMEASKRHTNVWSAFLCRTGFVHTTNGVWAEQVSQSLADSILTRLKVSNAFREQTLRLMRPLPAGAPTKRDVREIAQCLQADLPDWFALLEAKCACLPDDVRASESVRLEAWRIAMAPYLADPASALIHWPANLSQCLTKELGLKGKTLGLCLKYCSEAVLDNEISDHDDIETIVAWARAHFEPDA